MNYQISISNIIRVLITISVSKINNTLICYSTAVSCFKLSDSIYYIFYFILLYFI